MERTSAAPPGGRSPGTTVARTVEPRAGARGSTPRVCVLAPTPYLTVTIESGQGGDEVHVHPGGQGLWVARMARSLGAEVVVCGPFGGESGTVVAHLATVEHLEVRATGYLGNTGTYVHDRREGDRRPVATMFPPTLNRHELDDLYSTVLVEALDADVCVLTGADPAQVVVPAFFGRLAGDLRAAGIPIVADLSGGAALAVADAGPDVLKMSHEELLDADLAADDELDTLRAAAHGLLGRGVRAMVVSRAEKPCLLVTAEQVCTAIAPSVTTVDHRGAGDSMTAGLAVGVARGLPILDALRLGAAAGALNVTRRGLGTGRREQVERFAGRVEVSPVPLESTDPRPDRVTPEPWPA